MLWYYKREKTLFNCKKKTALDAKLWHAKNMKFLREKNIQAIIFKALIKSCKLREVNVLPIYSIAEMYHIDVTND
jgi:hypothetical protein